MNRLLPTTAVGAWARHLLVLFGACALPACGAGAAPGAPSLAAASPAAQPVTEAAPPTSVAAPEKDASNVDGALADVERARAELDRVLAALPAQAGGAFAKAPMGKAEGPSSGAKPKAASAPPPLREEKNARGLSADKADAARVNSEDACSTACTALSSMTRSTNHLCELTGGGDSRCTEARARLAQADARVRSACPVCPH